MMTTEILLITNINVSLTQSLRFFWIKNKCMSKMIELCCKSEPSQHHLPNVKQSPTKLLERWTYKCCEVLRVENDEPHREFLQETGGNIGKYGGRSILWQSM